MNKVLLRTEEIPMPVYRKEAERFLLRVLEVLDFSNWELSVLFCTNRYIKTLNVQYRDKDEPTDVLSFPLGAVTPDGRYLAGDIVVSMDALEENAEYFKIPMEEELRRLLVHGILHLSGYDHTTNKAGEPMLKLQEKILTRLAENVQ